MTIIDISSQTGDASSLEAIMPHFNALKAAAKLVSVNRFPYPELSFILRVDGSLQNFGLSGPGRIDFDRRRKWVSIDIGIPVDIWKNSERTGLVDFICKAIVDSATVLRAQSGDRLANTDWDVLASTLSQLCVTYRSEVSRVT